MAITTISHGSTLPYADPAALQHISFAGLFDAPGRSNFIPADRAFVFDFQQHQHDLTLNWQVKEGYYLYRKQVSITPAQASVGALQMPAGEWHEDEFYGKSEIYRQRLSVPVTVNRADKGATLTVTYRDARMPDSAIRRKQRWFRLVR